MEGELFNTSASLFDWVSTLTVLFLLRVENVTMCSVFFHGHFRCYIIAIDIVDVDCSSCRNQWNRIRQCDLLHDFVLHDNVRSTC